MSTKITPLPSRLNKWVRLPAFGRNTSLLIAITTVNSIALVSAGALVNPYLRNLGMSAAFVGLYFSVSAIVQGFAAFTGGFLADTFGRRRVWVFGKFLQIGAYLVLASGVRGPWILAAAVLSGLSQMGVGAVSAFQADASESSWRATYFAVIQTVNSLAGAIAPLAGGLIADRYGAQWAFAAILPLLAIVARMIGQLQEKPPARPAAASASARTEVSGGSSSQLTHPVPAAAAARSGLRDRLSTLANGVLRGPYPRTAMGLLTYALLNGCSNGIINITLPLWMRDRFGMGYTGIAGTQTASALGMVLTVIIGARLADRLGRRKIILAAMGSGAVLFCAIPFLTSAAQMYGIVFLFGMFANAGNGAFSATAMECVTEDSRATFGGVYQGLNAGGVAIGSLVAGVSYATSYMLPMYIAAAIFCTGFVVLVLLVQETSQPKLAAPAEAAAGTAAAG